MKFCSKCGAEIFDDAVVCVKCGRAVETAVPNAPVAFEEAAPAEPSDLAKIANVFMIIGTIAMALCTCLVGLAWCLPMTISYANKIKKGEPVGTAFKVCSLLFVNTIAGILMLCDKES